MFIDYEKLGLYIFFLLIYPSNRVSHVCMLSCIQLCNLTDSSLPGSSVHGILQARVLEWIFISSSRHLPDPEIKLASPSFTGEFFTTEPTVLVGINFILRLNHFTYLNFGPFCLIIYLISICSIAYVISFSSTEL